MGLFHYGCISSSGEPSRSWGRLLLRNGMSLTAPPGVAAIILFEAAGRLVRHDTVHDEQNERYKEHQYWSCAAGVLGLLISATDSVTRLSRRLFFLRGR